MNGVETARALLEAAAARDSGKVADLAAPGAGWTTPRRRTYAITEVATEVVPREDEDGLTVTREGHRYEEPAPGRVLVLYETVYRWAGDEGLENRVPSGYVVEVGDGRVTGVRAFLDAEKAVAAARAEAAAA